MILISSVVTPLRVAFYDADEVEWVVIEAFIDIVFLFDILFSFFSAYYNKMEALISDRSEIATGYLKSWFFVDLVSIFPLSFLANSTVNQLAKLTRMPRIYKIIKTSKYNSVLIQVHPSDEVLEGEDQNQERSRPSQLQQRRD